MYRISICDFLTCQVNKVYLNIKISTSSCAMSNLASATTGPLNFINGKRVLPIQKSLPPKFHPVTQPATGEILCNMPLSDEGDVNSAVGSAKKAFLEWSRKTGLERGAVLCKTAQLLKSKAEEIAKLEVLDCGKPIWEARFDIEACAQAFHYFGGLAQSHCKVGEHLTLNDDAFAYIRREPLGVCAGIGAWNFPFLVASWKVAPALACGNTMVYKPSEFTPLTAVVLAEVLQEADLPNGALNIIQGDGAVGSLLCSHPDVAKVSFTGSIPTGRKVMTACANGVKKITLELGGKSPLIIFEDCNLENAVKGALLANFLSQGQVCSNGTRIFVQKSIAAEFLEKFVEKTKKLKVGDPMLEDTKIGATIHEQQAEKVLRIVQGAKKDGAKVLCGGDRVHLEDPRFKNGYYLSPCILSECTDNMEVVKEEIFGAVACVLTFDTEEEVLNRANDSKYGLAGAVFTKDISRAHRVAARLESGTIWINTYNAYPCEVPFGGYKMSGIGRENGLAVIEHYTQLKSVFVELGNVDCPLYTD